MPGALTHQPDRDSKLGQGPDRQVLNVERLRVEIAGYSRMQRLEAVRLEGLVDISPPDLLGARALADHELILRCPAGMGAGSDDDRPGI